MGLESIALQRATLDNVEHRPWPIPEDPWFMGQTWLNLAFAHWPVERSALERVVPPQLPIDTFDGAPWLGVSPFVVSGLRLRGTPPLPGFSSFAEINVRTYVDVGGKPGIYFFSLDADSRAAVLAARRVYRLPYFRSSITVATRGEGVERSVRYLARRVSGDGPPARFEGGYGPAGEPEPAQPGTIARWLAERYCLYTLDERQRIWRAEIHHPPWPLAPAWVEIDRNTMGEQIGIELRSEPLAHFCPRQDVVLWRLTEA